MSKFEDYPHKCVKCGATDLELHEFTYARSKGTSKSYKTVYISFPTCEKCKKVFGRYYKLENIFENMRYVMICSAIIAGFTYFTSFPNPSEFTLTLFIIATIITLVGVVLMVITYTHPNRIRKYVKLKKSGKIEIKDTALQEEIVERVLEKKAEEIYDEIHGINTITCPKCGSQQRKGIDFCTACGKELRNL